MRELESGSVNLVITSPPYNVGKEYETTQEIYDYLSFLRRVWSECYRVLASDGRICVNVANTFRRPYVSLSTYVAKALNDTGFHMRGEIIWNKGASVGVSTAWGSWLSASNPTLRDVHEYILIFSKETYNRQRKGESTITRDEFLEYTKSIWTFSAESAKRIGHPAPFPIELPRRLIQLYSYKDDLILDPFLGSGTTALACLLTNRQYVGYDTSAEYLELAKRRIKQLLDERDSAFSRPSKPSNTSTE
jgi:site-specific DNA-methyltransferase (adenine-specific)